MSAAFGWPHGKRIAVIVTVLLENWSDRMAPSYSPMTTALKPGTYDRAGVTWAQYGGNAWVWRLMHILNRMGIKATICANAKSIELHADAMKMALHHGHEVAAHGYTQDGVLAYMDSEEELATIRRCIKVFEDTLGFRPLGWLSPVIATTDVTAEHLAAERFLWHGDYNDDDLPRQISTKHGPIVALPHSDFADNRVLRQSPRTYFDAYKTTFDYLYHYEPGSLINLTVHCQFGGRPLIASVFTEILCYFQKFDDVWVVRHDEMARWFRETGFEKVSYAQRFFAPAG